MIAQRRSLATAPIFLLLRHHEPSGIRIRRRQRGPCVTSRADLAAGILININELLLFFQESVNVESTEATDSGGGAAHFHDVAGVFDGRFTENAQAIAAGIVLFFHEHIEVTRLRQEADRLARAETFLGAIAVFFTMFADLKIAGKIDNLTDHGANGAGVGFPVDRGAQGGCAPSRGGLIAHLAERLLVGTLFDGHLGLQNAALAFALREQRRGQGQKGQSTQKRGGEFRHSSL